MNPPVFASASEAVALPAVGAVASLARNRGHGFGGGLAVTVVAVCRRRFGSSFFSPSP